MSLAQHTHEQPVPLLPTAARKGKPGMTILEAFRIAFQGLIANKLRSFLTMLGIIIGVSSVIIMVALGQGVAKATQDSIRKMGTNVLSVYPASQMRGGVSAGLGTQQTLKMDDVDVIKKNCPSVKIVVPEYRGSGTVKFQNQNTRTTVYGASPEFFEIRNQPLADGRYFDKDDVDRKAKVAVLGDTVRETLFGSLQAVGKYVKVNGQSFKVVGTIQKRGSSGFRSPDDQITIPVTTAMIRVFGVDYLGGMSVQAVSEAKMKDAEDEIKTAINKAHRTPPGEEDVRVFNQADLTESANAQNTFLTMLLAGIAMVSLIVGGIGIMNIMLVSVTERTREIGIRKALGAKRRDILYQFLIESVTLSLVGGALGLAVGVGGSLWMAKPQDEGGAGFPMLLSAMPMIVSFGFSAFVGIFFGIYPAMKASRLDPIEALRYE
ncbi:MAG: FtsX-like permease family protein [Armatimonadetes bacterium]|nr:FtsX-like permease family protein [Armatimonadota bacterium]